MEIGNIKLSNKYIIIIAIAAAIGSVGGKYIVDKLIGVKNPSDRHLIEMANQFNKNLPLMADSNTRLDTTMAMPGNNFMYIFTLINLSINELDINDFNEIQRPNIVNSLKTNPDMFDFRKNKVTLVYVYRDKNNNEITRFEITYDEYE